jgi:hypothetical protein
MVIEANIPVFCDACAKLLGYSSFIIRYESLKDRICCESCADGD